MGSIGSFLKDFCDLEDINIKNTRLPQGTDAIYEHARGGARKGVIKLGQYANALLLGHEIRHAWQHLRLPPELFYPSSAQAQILLDRFIEADARAIEFGVALQTIHEMRVENGYAWSLLASMGDCQKEIIECSVEKLDEICSSPEKLKQAMRQAFDGWIAISPAAPSSYREKTEKTLRIAHISKIGKRFFDIVNGGRQPIPCYTESDMDGDYPGNLAAALGFLGDHMNGNYLMETKGPAFNSPFYTRICDFRLECAVDGINARFPRL
ncbi:MAG: hypothetical protein HY370_02500 [Proteobacteria bacterium]|nr:hypothetical protein [Pseudomonadota bacterium]